MISQWYKSKEKVIRLRQQGFTLTEISNEFNIPKSTLSSWFKNIKLNSAVEKILEKKKKIALQKAREKAVKWHNEQKRLRLEIAKKEAFEVVAKIDSKNKECLEMALAFLYLGEGAKKNFFSIANTNPEILEFFLNAIKILYNQNRNDLKYELHLRYDQNKQKMKKYWSERLKIPIDKITYCFLDSRTKGKKTLPNYMGVCVIIAKNIKYTRRLLEIAKLYSSMISK